MNNSDYTLEEAKAKIEELEAEKKAMTEAFRDLEEDLGFWKREAILHSDAREQFKKELASKETLISLAEDIVTANGWENDIIPPHILTRRNNYIKEWNK